MGRSRMMTLMWLLAPLAALHAKPALQEGREPDATAVLPTFVIVAPGAWAGALEPFVAARAREFRVELAPLEATLADSPGSDAPERLKRHLYAAWKERGARYVLLVGDADTCPVRFMVLDRVHGPAHNIAFYPSDLYYADVADAAGDFDDWNASREGHHARYFGEVHGEHHKDGPIDFDRVSYVPELALGRWPVSSEEELRAVVAKTLRWQPPAAAPRALLVHAPEWVDARARLGELGLALSQGGFEVARQFYGDAPGVPAPPLVRDALLAGTELALHVGHGTNDSWHLCLGEAERAALSEAQPSFYFSVGCSTAHLCVEPPYQPYLDEHGLPHAGTNAGQIFDAPPPPPAPLQPGRFNSTGLGERLLRMPQGGALAYIGCNTGAQPAALTLMDGFVLALAAERSLRIGDAWRSAMTRYVEVERLFELQPSESWYPPSIFFQGMKFMLFGDPTLRLASPAAD